MEAAKTYDSQVILTTHSPSVVRALTDEASLVWMKNGARVQENTEVIRRDMGWGILDKSILLITEDAKVGMLNSILNQWPDLRRKTAVWPVRGNSSLPPAAAIEGLSQLFSTTMRFLIHRDSDFMLKRDQEILAEPYREKSLPIWFTSGSDIESCWLTEGVISSHFRIPTDEARDLLDAACQRCDEKEARKVFNTKRNEIGKSIKVLQRRR